MRESHRAGITHDVDTSMLDASSPIQGQSYIVYGARPLFPPATTFTYFLYAQYEVGKDRLPNQGSALVPC